MKATSSFSDIYKDVDHTLATHFIQKLALNLESGKHTYISTKILARFYDLYTPDDKAAEGLPKSRTEFWDIHEAELNLLPLLF